MNACSFEVLSPQRALGRLDSGFGVQQRDALGSQLPSTIIFADMHTCTAA
jgi:hypothetical protein